MKIIDKITFVLFSCIILIVSIVLEVVIFGWVNIETINSIMKYILTDPFASNITLGVLLVFIVLSIKAIYFPANTKKQDGVNNGILIQNENGKLFISKATIQNLVSGIVKSINGARDVETAVILTKENNINIDVTLFVNHDIIIKDLSNDLQLKIKDIVKKSMDIEIKEVNIKVKNIAPKQEADED